MKLSDSTIYIELCYSSAESLVPISKEANICPRGYVLALGQPSKSAESASVGQCTYCSQGTYSVNPLYGGDFSEAEADLTFSSPKCLTCPAANICLGGDKVMHERTTCLRKLI